MKRVALLKTQNQSDLAARHKEIVEMLDKASDAIHQGTHYVHLTSGWTAMSIDIRDQHGAQILIDLGFILWPNFYDQAGLKDEHHIEKVPKEAKITSLDTPFQAAMKLYEHTKWGPLHPDVF